MGKTIFTIRLLLPFIAFIFFVPYIASSQESTEKLDAMYDSGSIVREVNADSLLVYSNINVCSFSLIKNGDPNVDILKLNNILSVSDFEIDGKTVYLCGEMLGGKTFMGYFERINAKLQYIVGHYDTQIMDPDYKGTPLVLTCGEIDENNH